jgi:predicted NBD/HSP70 family sugar kinase
MSKLLDARQREFLRLIWRENRLSRWELHQRTGVNPNAVGTEAAALLSLGILREAAPEPVGQGRPRVPLEIDTSSRDVVGLALSPGQVDVARLNLRGQLLGAPQSKPVATFEELVPTAARLLKSTVRNESLAIGISSPGFLDSEHRVILFSSLVRAPRPLSVQPLYEAAAGQHIVFENDMHALAVRWALTHQAEQSQDVLLVYIGDGRLGAALLIDGRPNRGCLIGANELGHTRFFVDVEKCYCGQVGCLERICSSTFLNGDNVPQGATAGSPGATAGSSSSARSTVDKDSAPRPAGSLFERIARYDGSDERLGQILQYLACGLSNAINFVRPDRLVLVSELTRYPAFNDRLLREIRSGVLFELVERVRIDVWDQPGAVSAETAGWLALAGLYQEGWNAL